MQNSMLLWNKSWTYCVQVSNQRLISKSMPSLYQEKARKKPCKCLKQIYTCLLNKLAYIWPNQSTQNVEEVVHFQKNIPKPSDSFNHNSVVNLRNTCRCSSTQWFGWLISSHSELIGFPIPRWLFAMFLFINWVIWNSKSISQRYIEVHIGFINVNTIVRPYWKAYPLHSPKGVRKGLGLTPPLSLIFYKNFIICAKEIIVYAFFLLVNLST